MTHSIDGDNNPRPTGETFPLPVTLRSSVAGVATAVSSTNALPVAGRDYSASVTITRPANTTAYTAGDAVGVDPGVLQVETATAAGTITAGTSQVETATAAGTITAAVSQVETATAVGTITAAVAQVETATALGTISTAGNAAVVITGDGIVGSPLTVNVAVALNDTAATWAGKVRTALDATAAVANLYTVGGSTTAITLTRRVPTADDATLNISLDNGTCAGITTAATSADTTAGVAGGTGNAAVVVTAAGITGSPITFSVAVGAGDTAAMWADKVRNALRASSALAAAYTVGGSGASITLTAVPPKANDATLNISLDNGTCTGITTAASSANTTAGVATGAGNAAVVVTGAGITGSPITLNVAVADGDTAATWAGKVRTALAADAAIAAVYTVSGGTTAIVLTRITKAANDATLNISLDNGTCTGITTAASSANTTAGVATGEGNAAVVVTGAGITGSPITLNVAVADGDTAATWAGKVRTALAANAAIAAVYTVSGATTAIVLTRITKAADDATLNISLDNGTCAGITTAASSANTTAGAATSASAGSAILTLADIGPAGGRVTISDVNLEVDVAAIPSGMSTFRLHFYNESPDAILDNAAWDLASAGDRLKYLGYVDLNIPVDLGSTLYSQNNAVYKTVKLATGATALYGVLQTIGGFTPSSGAVKVLNVHAFAA